MWQMIPTLQPLVEDLRPAFTQPSFTTTCDLLLAWVMCLGKHTLYRVACNRRPDHEPDRSQRHGLDTTYNYFERSAWAPKDLAYRVAVLIVTRLSLLGPLTLLVDDTLAHKRGKQVWGLGWFRDAVASTHKRTATASGHNWVVLAVAVCLPFSHAPILALPLMARLYRKGKKKPSCAQLGRQMLDEVLEWFPQKRFILIGDGAYAGKKMMARWPERVTFVGWMRSDAAVYEPGCTKVKPSKEERLATPKQAAESADGKRSDKGEYGWQTQSVTLYGRLRQLLVCSYEAWWPTVYRGGRCRVLVVRDKEGKMRDGYLFCSDPQVTVEWMLVQYSWRWSIETLFRASKQVMELEYPQHWCESSVEKLAPWVWSMQSVIMVWYITQGYQSAEGCKVRASRGPWDSEWSLRTMMMVLKRSILNETFNGNSEEESELRDMVQTLKNWAILAA